MSSLFHEVAVALAPLVNAFEHLNIPYYIGGSVSSSYHGIARQTLDVDVIAGIQSHHVHTLATRLQQEYYLDEEAWLDAIRQEMMYNVLYLESMTKVDVMPLKPRAFTHEEARRAQLHILEPGYPAYRLASAEDAVLSKLEWYQMGGRVSSRQWNDIVGVLAHIRKDPLDLFYLHRWAETLNVRDLLENALQEAGLPPQ